MKERKTPIVAWTVERLSQVWMGFSPDQLNLSMYGLSSEQEVIFSSRSGLHLHVCLKVADRRAACFLSKDTALGEYFGRRAEVFLHSTFECWCQKRIKQRLVNCELKKQSTSKWHTCVCNLKVMLFSTYYNMCIVQSCLLTFTFSYNNNFLSRETYLTFVFDVSQISF